MFPARFHVFNTILWLLSSISSVKADPVCDLAYGQPTYSDCRDLVLKLYSAWPGQSGDRREHFFSLRGEQAPPWIKPGAQRLRLNVPRFMFHG